TPVVKHMSDAQDQPKNWSDMSLDLRILFVFHACMMVLMLAHFAFHLGILGEITVVVIYAISAVFISVRNRKRCGWHWPGTDWKGVLGALGSAALILFFLGAVLPGTSIFNPNLFPWLAAGGNFLVFAVLGALNVTTHSKKRFLAQCGQYTVPEPPAPPMPMVPRWKRVLGTIFAIYFMAAWVSGVAFFWKFNSAMAHGSAQPTATQTEKLNDHGHSAYITPREKLVVKRFELAFLIGIPSAMVFGLVLRFVAGVDLNDPKNPL